MSETNLLELATATDRPTIRIDGKRFEMRTPEEFSWADNQLIAKRGKRFQKLVEAMQSEAGLSEQEGGELESLASEMVDLLVVDLDADTKGKLKPLHQLKIFEAFSTLSRVDPPTETANPTATAETSGDSPSPTPANSLPDSSDSTEATPNTG